jgi:hypothetical protein
VDKKTGELGFEPRLTESESVVLPLHYSPLLIAPVGARPLAPSGAMQPTFRAADSQEPEHVGDIKRPITGHP